MASFFAVFLLMMISCRNAICSEPRKGFNGKLQMDKAFVNITSNLAQKINVLGISTNCYKCPLQTIHTGVKTSAHVIVPTHYNYVIVINTADTSKLCSLSYLYGEYGWYEYAVRQDDKGKVSCDLTVTKEPHNPNIPILVAFIVLVVLAVLWLVYSRYNEKIFACRRKPSDKQEEGDNTTTPAQQEVALQDVGDAQAETKIVVEPEPNQTRKKRLKSLDTFRGIAITVMIFVNFGGGGYYFFGHAVWNGLLFADLVFPWFIWIMGVSITLSFKSIKRKKLKSSKVLLKIVRRSLVLFGLGIFTSNFNDLEFYRIPGVLQRFAVCYFVIALMQLYLGPRDEQPKCWWDPIRDVVYLWKQWICMFVVLSVYVIVTHGIKVGECPQGYTGPGGLGIGYPLAINCTGGVANYFDRMFLGNHIYRWPTVKALYKTTLPHDPEGCLGTLTSIFLVFLGVQAGRILHTYPGHKDRIVRWTIWGVLLGVIGIGLCGGTKNEGAIPINKNLWSVSFIFVTGATSYILLVICYILTDTFHWWNGAPFFYPGMNSILLYVGHGILYNNFPFSWKTNQYVTHTEKLAMNLIGTALWILISFYLYQKKFFLKV